MTFTPEEQKRVENFILFLIKKKEQQSGGHNGLHIGDITNVLDQMEEAKKIKIRPNTSKTLYFLNN